MKILIVDDEAPIRELLKYNLEKEGFSTLQAENAAQAVGFSKLELPDLILLDLMLPDLSGLEVCKILKKDKVTEKIPIIMVTAKTEDEDVVVGLELGADDYITKPFSPKVLIARVNSVVRRSKKSEVKINNQDFICVNKLKIDIKKHEISWDNTFIDFSATEFAIVEFLAKNVGQVFSRQQIINAVKGSDYPVTARAIDVQILGIRKKLEQFNTSVFNVSDLICTIRGIGYRMQEDKNSDA